MVDQSSRQVQQNGIEIGSELPTVRIQKWGGEKLRRRPMVQAAADG